jgi:hypothetical protein
MPKRLQTFKGISVSDSHLSFFFPAFSVAFQNTISLSNIAQCFKTLEYVERHRSVCKPPKPLQSPSRPSPLSSPACLFRSLLRYLYHCLISRNIPKSWNPLNDAEAFTNLKSFQSPFSLPLSSS